MEMEESFKSNLNTVKEMILDEEKIVTYVSLSKDLCIHINTSKKLLHVIAKDIVEQCPDVKLNVNYIISGITDDNKARTTVCTEKELNNIKMTLKTIFYDHVYSVSKGSPLTDHTAYLLLNKFDDYHLCAGLIKSIECIKHTSDEIGSLKSSSQQAASIESNKTIIPQKKIKTESKNIVDAVKNSLLEKNTNGEVNEKLKLDIKSEVVSPTKETSNKKQNNNKSNSHNHSNNKTQKGIAGFFNKSNTTQKKALKEPEQKSNIVLKESKSIEIKKENMEIDTEIPSEEPEKDIKNESNKKNKVLNQIKKTSKVDKKRKRVLHVSDSDNDDENDPFADKLEKQEVKNESDDEIPPTPSVNSIKITSGLVNPKKRRKVVDKTYTDEDGYILTKKEEIYESCSENEEDVKVKENVKEIKSEKSEYHQVSPKEKKNTASTKKKISPPQKGKQPTLAHFFTKK